MKQKEILEKVHQLLELEDCVEVKSLSVETIRKEIIMVIPVNDASVTKSSTEPPVKKKKRKSFKSSPSLGFDTKVGGSSAEGKYSAARKYTTSDEDLNIIRQHHFSKWKKEKKLSEDQLFALSNLSMRVSKMNADQRNQILGIFEDV